MGSPEWKTRELEHLKTMWTEKQHTGLPHTKKMWDTIAEEWEKDLRESQARQERSRKRVEKTAEFLIAEGALNSDTEVIDIGCGPGRFVAEFAKTARKAAGLDLSEQMAEYGLKYCHEQGLENVSFIVEDFKTMDPEEKGLKGKYDLVFSSITPALGYRGGFLKALSMSKRWFFNAAFINNTDSLLDELDRILGTNSSDPKNSEGFYVMFNEMLLRNYYPSINYYTEEGTETYSEEEALEKYCRLIWKDQAGDEERRALRAAIGTLKGEDGLLRTHKRWVYGWMLLDLRKADCPEQTID